MDVFIEQIVYVRKTPSKLLLSILIWLVAIVLMLAVIFASLVGMLGSFGMFAMLAGVGLIYLAWWLTSGMNVEYEYSITNGYIDVDMIIAQRKRKRVLAAQCKDFESFGKFNPAQHEHRQYDKRIIAGNLSSENAWYGTLRHKEHGHVLLVFEPEQRVLEAIRKFLPKLVANDAFRGL